MNPYQNLSDLSSILRLSRGLAGLPHCVGTNRLAATRCPDGLLPYWSASMGCIDHPAGPHEDADMSNVICAITIRCPEDQITCLGFGAGKVVSHSAGILSLGRPGDGFPLCMADGVLGKSCRRLKVSLIREAAKWEEGRLPEQSNPPLEGPEHPPPPHTYGNPSSFTAALTIPDPPPEPPPPEVALTQHCQSQFSECPYESKDIGYYLDCAISWASTSNETSAAASITRV